MPLIRIFDLLYGPVSKRPLGPGDPASPGLFWHAWIGSLAMARTGGDRRKFLEMLAGVWKGIEHRSIYPNPGPVHPEQFVMTPK